MSLTEFTEWLAREMPPGTVISDPRWWAPRIAARFATTQPPKPAECAIQCPPMQVCDHCAWPTGKDGQPPKPAGAVALPEPDGYLIADGEQLVFSKTRPIGVLARDVYGSTKLHRYGDAREAAGRAVAVPDGFALVPRELTEAMSLEAQVQVAGVDDEMLSEIWEAFLRTAAPIPQQPAAEGDDIAVDRFAEAMKEKMAAARAKGRGGWEGPTCNADILSRMLRDHVEKGDPRDVANFCMMLWNRGEAIQAAEGAGREAVASIKEVTGDGGGKVLDWPKGMVRFLREHPVGTKLYTHPAPAADAGGVKVTEEMVERVWMAATGRTRLGKGWENDAKFMTAEERADTRAALAPEVRHGE